jgi:nucleotide-binding universal stress UspA family protein
MQEGQSGRAVVVGVDGSRNALRAVRWAAAEAARRHAPLRLVTACPGRHADDVAEHRSRDIVLGQATGALVEAAHVAERVQQGLAVQRQLVAGPPVPVLHAHARKAQLVVVGDRGRGGVGGWPLGSVAAALGRCAVCPVVVVRGEDGPRDPARPVVVGVDGTSTSDAAVAFAFAAAAARAVELVAVHTWWELLDTIAPYAGSDAIEAREREVLDERLAGWCGKYPDVPVRRLVQRDLPAHALTELSREAQLVVVGSRRRGWLAGMVLGSVSQTLLHRAHCPVAVVPVEHATS